MEVQFKLNKLLLNLIIIWMCDLRPVISQDGFDYEKGWRWASGGGTETSSSYANYALYDLGQGFGGGAVGPVYICGWLGGFEGTYALGAGYGYTAPDIKEVAFVASQRIMSRMPYWGYF